MQTNHEQKYEENAIALVLKACIADYEEVAAFTVRNKSFINFLQGRLFEITAEDANVPEQVFSAVVAELKSLRDDQAEGEAFYRSIDETSDKESLNANAGSDGCKREVPYISRRY